MNVNIYNPYVREELYLMHHGIFGQRWGKRNGPPYPLSAGAHSASEKKAGWRKSLDNGANRVGNLVKSVGNDLSRSFKSHSELKKSKEYADYKKAKSSYKTAKAMARKSDIIVKRSKSNAIGSKAELKELKAKKKKYKIDLKNSNANINNIKNELKAAKEAKDKYKSKELKGKLKEAKINRDYMISERNTELRKAKAKTVNTNLSLQQVLEDNKLSKMSLKDASDKYIQAKGKLKTKKALIKLANKTG